MNHSSNSSGAPFKLPIWAQLGLGLVFVILIYLISLSSSSYVSAWDEEDSNFFESATQGLRVIGLNPSSPTAIIFWEKDCKICEKSMRAFRSTPSSLRVYGIHLSDDRASEIEIRKKWISMAPRGAILKIDRQQLLQTSFKVKGVPMIFIYLPKQKKIYSFLGDVNKKREQMLDIIASE